MIVAYVSDRNLHAGYAATFSTKYMITDRCFGTTAVMYWLLILLHILLIPRRAGFALHTNVIVLFLNRDLRHIAGG